MSADFLRSVFVNRSERQVFRRLRPASEFTEVILSKDLGREVIASEQIEQGTLVGVYPGQVRKLSEFYGKEEFAQKSMRYAYQLSSHLVIDPSGLFGSVPDKPELRLSLVNEPPPGARVNIFPLSSENYVWFIAISDIANGAPLYTTYGNRYSRNYPTDLAKTNGEVELTEVEAEVIAEVLRRHRFLKLIR